MINCRQSKCKYFHTHKITKLDNLHIIFILSLISALNEFKITQVSGFSKLRIDKQIC